MIHRFAIDKMLGRLATWLRIIGQDATYGAHLSGPSILCHARAEGRTVLTRDRRLWRRRVDVPLVFIESDHFRAQLQQVITTFGIDPFAHTFTRCALCNEPVLPVQKDEVAAAVPPYVFATQAHFVRCPRCRRIYWPATHSAHVHEQLQTLATAHRD
jgi:uncharacterized protein